MEATMGSAAAGGNYTHDIGYVDALKKLFNNYINFEGRANRGEFWKAYLMCLLISIALGVVDAVIGMPILGTIFSLGIIVPQIAIGARRLHDIGKSGWWMLIALVPIVGIILLIVWYAKKPDMEPNQYG